MMNQDDREPWKTGAIVVLVFVSQTSQTQTWDLQKNLLPPHACIGRGMRVSYGSCL